MAERRADGSGILARSVGAAGGGDFVRPRELPQPVVQPDGRSLVRALGGNRAIFPRAQKALRYRAANFRQSLGRKRRRGSAAGLLFEAIANGGGFAHTAASCHARELVAFRPNGTVRT